MGLNGVIPSRKCFILRHLQNEDITHSVMLPEALEHFVLLKTQTWPICFEDSSIVGLTKNRYKTSSFFFFLSKKFFYQEHKFIYSIFCKNSAIMPYHIFYKVSDGEKNHSLHQNYNIFYYFLHFFLPNLMIFPFAERQALMVWYTANCICS